MQLVIMAAGLGSRFGGLKQMEPMDEYGNFLLDYAVYDAKEAGFDEVVFIIKHSIEKDFKDTIGKRVEKIMKVSYAFQELEDIPEGFVFPEGREKPWGTAHAILAAKNVINGPFMIINGDDFYGKESYKDAYRFMSSLDKNAFRQYGLVSYKVKNTISENGSVKRGVCMTNDDNNIINLIESSISNQDGKIIAEPLTKEPSFEIIGDQPVSMNMICFTKDYLDYIEEGFKLFLNDNCNLKSEYLVPEVLREMITNGKATLKNIPTDSVWYGITYREDKEKVSKALKELVNKGLYKEGLY